MQRVVEAAELEIVSVADDATSILCRSAQWPGQHIEIAAASEDLSANAEMAARDVKHLWPGRGEEWGAVALLSIGLRSALDVRTSAPMSVALNRHGSWVAYPPEEVPEKVARNAKWIARPRKTN